MSLFEYLAIAFSLVFSFSAARLVSGLPHALEPTRRYLVHVLQVFNLLFTTAAVFWAFWSFRNVEWDFVRFLFALASPGILFFLACTLVPEGPSAVASWREHFYKMRKRLFIGLGAWILVVAVNNTISLGIPLRHPARAMQLAVLSIAIVGAISDRPTVQAILAIGSSTVLVVMSALFFLPGALAA